TIRSVDVRGNAAFTPREITGWLSSRPGTRLSEGALRSDSALVLETYRAGGYLGAHVRLAPSFFSPDSAFVDILLVVEEGRRAVVSRIGVTGGGKIAESDILGRFDLAPGAPLDQTTLEKDIEALLVRYEKLGYPFVRCTVESLTLRPGGPEDSVEIALKVDEGSLVTIDEIRVEGNRETDASVITRETRLVPGEPFNPSKIDAVRERLNRLNIFSSVADPELYLRDGHGGLLVRVKEGNTNTFDGILGYIPPALPGSSGYLTGLASVSMRNLFGTGRKLSLRWQREDRLSQEIGIRYLEPWIFSLPVNIGGGFIQRQQDSTYVRRTVDLQSELMLSEELSVSLVLNSEKVIPASDSTTVAQVVGTTETTGGIDVQYDTRDDIYSPESGVRYHTDYHFGRKSIGSVPAAAAGTPIGGGTIQRLGVDLELYLPAFRRQVVAFGVHGREIRTGQVQPGEMYQFGGANSLRGYRENQFLGAEIAWTNAEYRFILARRSFLFGFLDTGYYNRPGDAAFGTAASRAFKYGYGIGIRLDTPLGNMGVSFALGQGDSFGTAKIHIGLINDF
ncbi:MAG TPA: POTRA domain-containing protein, partial [Bacteroidota bacterium]|nr:POTRA domain-containing protein [Bacteroidota bacterium]